jgi:peptidoglycan-associated lipoprotein
MRRERLQSAAAEAFRTIYFSFDQSSLSAEGKATTEAIARLMQEFPEVTVRVEGHADERGSVEYNLALGMRRANAVRQYLSEFGIDASRFETFSYGEDRPMMQGSGESAWSQNRRAAFRVTTGI